MPKKTKNEEKKESRPLSCTMFGGRDAEQYNALYSAFSYAAEKKGFDHEYGIYELIENSPEFEVYKRLLNEPRTTLVCQIVEALKAHGFEIKKVQ